MVWNLERVEQEVQIFADIAKNILGDIKAIEELRKCPIEISNRMTRTKGQFNFKYTTVQGKIVEVQYFEITKDKTGTESLRFPVFKHLRTDKTEPSLY